MKQDKSRHIVMKVLVNEEEEMTVRRGCAKAGKTFSAFTRELLLKTFSPGTQPAHRMPRRNKSEWPAHGQPRVRFPAQRAGARVPMRL